MPLASEHKLDAFSCGQNDLDHWLRERAGTSEGRTARTYVVAVGRSVVAYYCLSAGAVARSGLPRRIGHGNPDPVPVLVLGRLAVDRSCQGRGYGGGLLKDALLRAAEAARSIGIRAVLVHAIDDDAAAFYRRFGFVDTPIDERTLMLPIETIKAAL